MKCETCKQEIPKKKTITDGDGIVYEEVTYGTYLNSKTKHRIVQSLESRYFVEVEK